MHSSMWILLLSTASVAFFHALAPDHWLPFVAIAKSQKWSKSRLFWVTLLSGMGHVGISVVFSVTGILLGFSLFRLKAIEGHRGEVAIWLLIGFGIAYMLWGIKKAKGHSHKHIDDKDLKAKTVAVWTLFAIFVLGPCEPLVPLLFLGYNYGYTGVVIVSAIFSAITVIMMLAQTLLAFAGVQVIRGGVAERYSHVFAGLAVALTGIFVMAMGV